MPILYRFRDTLSQLRPTPPAFGAPVGVTPFELEKMFGIRKRVPGLSRGLVCVILHLAILVEHRLVTDTHADGHSAMAYTAQSTGRAVKNEY